MKVTPLRHDLSTNVQALIPRRRHGHGRARRAHLRRGWLPTLGAALLLIALLPGASASMVSATSGTWSVTGSLSYARYEHTATLLANGQVLVAGGYTGNCCPYETATAELYNPTTGTWSLTGSMHYDRYYHTATLLQNGEVLVAGGYSYTYGYVTTAELYNPSTGTWSTTGSMNYTRYIHTATLLPNGEVLVAGGCGSSCPQYTAELYNPTTGTWSITGSMSYGRYYHTATLLPNGQVLVAGGYGNGYLSSAELYNPSTGTWSTTGSMNYFRYLHTATLLNNGEVLVAGGYIGTCCTYDTSTAELYNPSTGAWSLTGSMSYDRYYHTATLLPNGQVLVAGGYSQGNGSALASAELYDPTAGTWATTGSLNYSRYLHTATLLPTGLLVVGGYSSNYGGYLSSAELYGVADTTPPSTSAVLSPPANAAGWNNTSTTLTLNAVDDSSVAATYYAIDDSTCAPGNTGSCSTYSSPLSFTAEGQHTVYYFSVDSAGNVEAQKSVAVNVDETPPNAPSVGTSPSPNAAGWNNSPVTVSFSSNGDTGSVQSGVAGCTNLSTISTETAGTIVSGTCTDVAGNVSNPMATTVKLDQTPPQTTQSLSALPTGCGSYYAPVTETLSANDTLSGVAATTYQIDSGTAQIYTGPFALTAPGSHTVSYYSTDVAGNVEATHTGSFQISQPPALASSLAGGSYGATIALTGSNFVAGETVGIYWDSTMSAPLATATVSSNCTVNATVSVPQGVAGAHTLIALGQMSGRPATATFTMQPRTALSIFSGPQSSQSVITGYGFGAHETVAVRWGATSGQLLVRGTTTSLGTIAGSGIVMTVPMSPTGSYKVYDIGQTSHAAAFNVFRVTPFLSIAPTSGTAGSSAAVGLSGFGAHETVTVRWDCAYPSCVGAPVLVSATTDGNGDLAGHTVTIPANASVGNHVIGAIGSTSHAFMTVQYTVNP